MRPWLKIFRVTSIETPTQWKLSTFEAYDLLNHVNFGTTEEPRITKFRRFLYIGG